MGSADECLQRAASLADASALSVSQDAHWRSAAGRMTQPTTHALHMAHTKFRDRSR